MFQPRRLPWPVALGFTLAAAVLLVWGAHGIAQKARQAILDRDAELTARVWGEFLVANLGSIADLLAGRPVSEADQRLLSCKRQTAAIFRFKIFDGNGLLRHVADCGRWDDMHRVAQGERSSDAAAVAQSGSPQVFARRGDGVSRPQLYAAAFMPLALEQDVMGVIEVYIDHTARARMLESVLLTAGASISALAGSAFALPALLALWHARERRKTAHRLRHVASHDELTGLLNRSALVERIDQLMARKTEFAVHFIDLDRFKDVNDNHGHPVGDALLREVAERLLHIASDSICVARLGGDEFAMVQELAPADELASMRLARRIVTAIDLPFHMGEVEARIGASVGTSLYPRDGQNRERLLVAADLALYAAKRAGRGRAVGFEASIEEERRSRQALEARLRQAVEDEDFEIYYQPLYSTDGKTLRAFEALLRLNAEDGAPISPSVFIPVAEELRLIDRIGQWVLREACQTATLWPASISIAVNLSPLQFVNGSLSTIVHSVLDETGIDPRRLELEMTESVLLEKPDAILAQLNIIKSFGVSIALDDFGTGYSSLSYLWRFPFDTLKVDGSFMVGLGDPASRSREVLDTIIALGRVLNLHVTAEGVETREQIEILRELHCDFVQGFLLGRPVRSTEVASVILEALKPRDEEPPLILPQRKQA
ncbi:MAG: EAL domain-containing protein [Methylobacterium sp.]|nr:EAL domain-containing protein [Methylobacterium sp.]